MSITRRTNARHRYALRQCRPHGVPYANGKLGSKKKEEEKRNLNSLFSRYFKNHRIFKAMILFFFFFLSEKKEEIKEEEDEA